MPAATPTSTPKTTAAMNQFRGIRAAPRRDRRRAPRPEAGSADGVQGPKDDTIGKDAVKFGTPCGIGAGARQNRRQADSVAVRLRILTDAHKMLVDPTST
ncbi:MAG: hypothetical protein AMXMBFR83_20630 [Phycisphaerae bacterium]